MVMAHNSVAALPVCLLNAKAKAGVDFEIMTRLVGYIGAGDDFGNQYAVV